MIFLKAPGKTSIARHGQHNPRNWRAIATNHPCLALGVFDRVDGDWEMGVLPVGTLPCLRLHMACLPDEHTCLGTGWNANLDDGTLL